MQVKDLTVGGLIGAAAVILVLVAAYNTIMSAVKTWREEQKRKKAPVVALEGRADETKAMLEAHTQMLQADRARLTALEEQQRIMLRALMAMLSHELNGNDVQKLRDSVSEINDFLIKK